MNLYRLALGGQTVKDCVDLCTEFELDQSQRKWVTKVSASQKLALSWESFWPVKTRSDEQCTPTTVRTVNLYPNC